MLASVLIQQIENCRAVSLLAGVSFCYLEKAKVVDSVEAVERQETAMYLSTSPTSNGPQHHHHHHQQQCGTSSPRRGSAPPLSFQLLAARKGSNPEFTSTGGASTSGAGSHKEGSSGFSILGFGKRKSSNASSNGHTP